jgi:hypothetical protein
MMRIGTWNLEGKSSNTKVASQLEFMAAQDCDVWLLTEVSKAFAAATLPGTCALSGPMHTDRAYAAVWARDGLQEQTSIHEAAAFATFDGLRVCSCVLPWRGVDVADWPDEGDDLATITRAAIARLGIGLGLGSGDLVWGGDWNQALDGQDTVSTNAGRIALDELIKALRLKVPTSILAHAADGGTCSVDHVAVSRRWNVGASSRLVAERQLSDHDAYVVEVELPPAGTSSVPDRG